MLLNVGKSLSRQLEYHYCAIVEYNGKVVEGETKTFLTEAILPNIVGMWIIKDSNDKVSGKIEVLEDGTAKIYDKNGEERKSWTSANWTVNAAGKVSIRFYRYYSSYNYSQDIWEYYGGTVNDISNPTIIRGTKTDGACNSSGGYSESSCAMTLIR